MTEPLRLRTVSVPMLDTGLGREAGFANDLELKAFAALERAGRPPWMQGLMQRIDAQLTRAFVLGDDGSEAWPVPDVDPVERILECAHLLEQADASVRVIYAHPEVPPGRLYRHYDTRGQLVLYANLDDVEALPKRVLPDAPSPLASPAYVWGIPVVLERPELPS